MKDQILNHLYQLAEILDHEKDPYRLMDLAVGRLKEIFSADSGWLIYPCDLSSSLCHIKYARTSPGFSNTFADYEVLPLTGEFLQCLTELFKQDGPLIRVAEGDGVLFQGIDGSCSVRSQIAMVVRMKNVRPWVIGLHQCGTARVWDPMEIDFFRYAVDRIKDGFDSKFLHKKEIVPLGNSQDRDRSSIWSEKRFRSLFHISSISLCLGELSVIENWFDSQRELGVISMNGVLRISLRDLKKLLEFISLFDMNRATLDLFEATDKQELNFGFHKCFTKYTQPALLSILEALYTRKKHISVEVPFKTLKGKYIDTILSVDVLEGEDANKILVSITDISVQKDSERKLLASLEKYRQLLETANDAILIIDAGTGRIQEANQKIGELLGKEVSEIIGQNRSVLHAPEDWQYYKDLFETQFKGGAGIEQRETAVLHSDGYKIPVEISVSKISTEGQELLLGIIHDIRGRLEQVKRQNLLATAIEKIDESVVITDPVGNIEYVNSAFEEVSGYAAEEVLGHQPNLMKGSYQGNGQCQVMWQTISKGEVWRGQFANTKKDGSSYREDVTVTPVLDPRGRVQHYVAVNRDITNQVAIENNLRQSQKMQAIGTLAGGIAHDFNNILTPIMGFAEMALLRAGGDELLRANMLEIVNAADRAGKLIDQILSFSKQAEKKTASHSVKTIVKEVFNLLRASLPSSIEILQDFETDARIRVDPTQLHQVIMNLCTNAYQAISGDGGKIRISLKSVTIGKREGVEMGHLNHGKYVRLRVEDNGRGIPREYLNRIFDPYFTTRNVNEGNGLGLSVVHGIVNEYGGTVMVDSEPGKGSCFDVFLPESEEGLDAR